MGGLHAYLVFFVLSPLRFHGWRTWTGVELSAETMGLTLISFIPIWYIYAEHDHSLAQKFFRGVGNDKVVVERCITGTKVRRSPGLHFLFLCLHQFFGRGVDERTWEDVEARYSIWEQPERTTR